LFCAVGVLKVMSYDLNEFRKRHIASMQYECLILYRLAMEGFGTHREAPRVRAENEDRLPFEETVDILIFDRASSGKKELKVEVKSKKVAFSTVKSWPFEDVTLFNENKKSIPDVVFFYSTESNRVLAVPNDGTWFKGRQEDHDPARNGSEYGVWKAPPSSLLLWQQVVPYLWEKLTGTARESLYPVPISFGSDDISEKDLGQHLNSGNDKTDTVDA
jgi:hypothetical protein